MRGVRKKINSSLHWCILGFTSCLFIQLSIFPRCPPPKLLCCCYVMSVKKSSTILSPTSKQLRGRSWRFTSSLTHCTFVSNTVMFNLYILFHFSVEQKYERRKLGTSLFRKQHRIEKKPLMETTSTIQ